DFCKLLTGSLGTLAVITQATLKLRPIPEADAFLITRATSFDHAERLLAALNASATRPAAVEMLVGWSVLDRPASSSDVEIVVGLEGTQVEVAWQVEQLKTEWQRLDVNEANIVNERAYTSSIWSQLTEFAASGNDQ